MSAHFTWLLPFTALKMHVMEGGVGEILGIRLEPPIFPQQRHIIMIFDTANTTSHGTGMRNNYV